MDEKDISDPSTAASRISDGWSFVHVTDMHIGSPRSYRFQPAWNDNWETARRQIIDLNPDLMLVGGDMTRDGTTHLDELTQAKADFESLPFPTYCIPGNHEVGNKYSHDSPVAIQSANVRRYRKVFGPSEWSFVVKPPASSASQTDGVSTPTVRFSGCDAFLLGSGLPEEAVLRQWLEAQVVEHHDLRRRALKQDSPNQIDSKQDGSNPRGPGSASKESVSKTTSNEHVWILHPALFADRADEPDFNRDTDRVAWYFALDNAERRYLFDILKATGVTHVITGHVHCRRHVEVDGIKIHFAPSTAFPQWNDRWTDGDPTLGFLHFHFENQRLVPQFVPLNRTSDRIGYGPGGNPPLEGRDYSVAWEKPAIVPVAV